jgi:hypothetical protein
VGVLGRSERKRVNIVFAYLLKHPWWVGVLWKQVGTFRWQLVSIIKAINSSVKLLSLLKLLEKQMTQKSSKVV